MHSSSYSPPYRIASCTNMSPWNWYPMFESHCRDRWAVVMHNCVMFIYFVMHNRVMFIYGFCGTDWTSEQLLLITWHLLYAFYQVVMMASSIWFMLKSHVHAVVITLYVTSLCQQFNQQSFIPHKSPFSRSNMTVWQHFLRFVSLINHLTDW